MVPLSSSKQVVLHHSRFICKGEMSATVWHDVVHSVVWRCEISVRLHRIPGKQRLAASIIQVTRSVGASAQAARRRIALLVITVAVSQRRFAYLFAAALRHPSHVRPGMRASAAFTAPTILLGAVCLPSPMQIPDPSQAPDSDDPSTAASWQGDTPWASSSSLAPLCTVRSRTVG